MKSYIKALAVIACLSISQMALARQVAVCYEKENVAYVMPLDTINCHIGNADVSKKTTLFEMTKAGWSIQAVTTVQAAQRAMSNGGYYFDYTTFIYLEKP